MWLHTTAAKYLGITQYMTDSIYLTYLLHVPKSLHSPAIHACIESELQSHMPSTWQLSWQI